MSNRKADSADSIIEVRQTMPFLPAKAHPTFELLLTGFILGFSNFAIVRFISSRIPFNMFGPFMILLFIGASSLGAFFYHYRGDLKSKNITLFHFCFFMIFVSVGIYNHNLTSLFLFTLMDFNIDLPLLRPDNMALHGMAEVCIYLTAPAFFFVPGLYFARALQQTGKPVFGYALHIIGFIVGGVLAYLLSTLTGVMNVIVLGGILTIYFLPLNWFRKTVVVLFCAFLMIISSNRKDQFLTWGVREYTKLESLWSPYYKLDFLQYDENCLGTVYNNILHYYTCSDPKKDFLQRRRILKPVTSKREDILIIGASGGNAAQTLLDLSPTVKRIVAVELDPEVVSRSKNEYAYFNGGVYNDPRVQAIAAEGRVFMNNDQASYDLIFMDGLDGSFNLIASSLIPVENHLFTVEGYNVIFNERLNPNGLLVIQMGGTLYKHFEPFIAALPPGVHYEVFWHYVTDMPFIGLPLYWIIASKEESVIGNLTEQIKRIPSVQYVGKRENMPNRSPIPTDDRPMLAFSPYSFFKLAFVIILLVSAVGRYAWRKSQIHSYLSLGNEQPWFHWLFITVGFVYAIGQTLLLFRVSRWFSSPSLGAIVVLTAILSGNALANLIYVLIGKIYRDFLGIVLAIIVGFAIFIIHVADDLGIDLLMSFVMAFCGGFFWPRLLSSIRSNTRGIAIALDGFGAIIGGLVYQMLFMTFGLTLASVVSSLSYLLLAIMILLLVKPILKPEKKVGNG
jgi:spermidine synthase